MPPLDRCCAAVARTVAAAAAAAVARTAAVAAVARTAAVAAVARTAAAASAVCLLITVPPRSFTHWHSLQAH